MAWFPQISILVCLLLMTCGLAIPKPDDDKKSRVYDKPLSDEEHYKGDEHNAAYDHEAFLGQEAAKSFEDLTPEESRSRLSIIVDKIDKDKDGFVTQEELKNWIQYTQKRYIMDDVDRQWKVHNPSDKEKLTWEDYKKATYGFMEDMDDQEGGAENKLTYMEMMRRDERRWKTADKDADGKVTKEEFADFLHPEEAPHMRDIVVQETMEDIDKDKDGRISMSEYIGDMYGGTSGDEEPDWVKNEREQFATYRDKNNDGYMDRDEVRDWIIPPDYDHSEAEARHLIYESDTDKDKKLTKEEILEKYDIFVGSQATDFGEALMRHEEF